MPPNTTAKLADLLHSLAYDITSGDATPEYASRYLHLIARAITDPSFQISEDGTERRVFAFKDLHAIDARP